ncbi:MULTISPECIES: hypothetical protein [unclassified Streptomyces]|uniref:hypothetical protein n=1 Tax=unclassified Streptomyces TaxID=2593676 RepID=UPI003BB79AF4
MTRAHASGGTSTHPIARPSAALAAAVLAVVTLSGCGSEEPSGGSGSRSEPSSDAAASAAPSSPEQVAFAAMLNSVARPCSSAGDATSRPTDEQPSGPGEEQSLAPGRTPPTDPIEPGAPTGPERELNDRDRCASVQHEQRIVQALQSTSKPTPAKVRKVLNSLGYIDERIHDLTQDRKVTRFSLDLRAKGGRLCEQGVAAGRTTEISACVAPATGSFAVQKSGGQPQP